MPESGRIGSSDGLDYPFAAAPAAGTVQEVGAGVFWLRMPLPFALDHINLWLLADGEGWTIVDTGMKTGVTRQLWEAIFATSLAGRPVTRLIVTHHHPDHVGLARWLGERWSIPVIMTEAEWLMGRMLELDQSDASLSQMVDFYRRAGCDRAALTAFEADGNSYAPLVEIPASFRRMGEGDRVVIGGHEWQVIIGRGHAPALACLYCPTLRLLICGDQLLPRITPNISVWPDEPEANPLPLYLDSLRRFRALPDDALVLPSHKLPYRGLWRRLDQLVAHHADRLELTRTTCRRPVTVMQLVDAMFRPGLDRHQLMFAVGEAMAHLHHLMASGEVRRTERDDDVKRYALA